MLPPLGKEAHPPALNGLRRIMNLNYLLLLLRIQTNEDPKGPRGYVGDN
jgi:hypothetical protein